MPDTYTIGRVAVRQTQWTDKDPRGILFMYEKPHPSATYVMGVDPTGGIEGWTREMRTRDDRLTDNAAIEVIRVGKPDCQVAEFAAPVEPHTLAKIANAIGRIYAGDSEDGMAHCICETTGIGVIAQRELISRYAYTNMFVWKYLDGMTVQRSTKFGWQASKDSNAALFNRSLHHINQKAIRVRSPHLVEEFADCTSDWILGSLRAKWGRHDDRVRAFFLAIWAAHDWSMEFDDSVEAVQVETAASDWQKSDITAAEMSEAWNDRLCQLLGED